MLEQEPLAELLVDIDEAMAVAWAEAYKRLERAASYWLATVRPDGRPHVMPVLVVGVAGALYFCAGASTRKAKNLVHNAHCVITVDGVDAHIVVEGKAAKVCNGASLRRVAEVYAARYDWHVTIRDGAFYADGAPTAGPPPYDVYTVAPTTAFGFGTDETFNATRWRF
jgi:nitroimidazol reductase NimA-like FMN-containing flavoprotein (pyridoxamine 5'-phosphate oxidase superfamily)